MTMTNVEKLLNQVSVMELLTGSLTRMCEQLQDLPDEHITPELLTEMYNNYILGLQHGLVTSTGVTGEVKFKSMEGALRGVTNALVQDLHIKH